MEDCVYGPKLLEEFEYFAGGSDNDSISIKSDGSIIEVSINGLSSEDEDNYKEDIFVEIRINKALLHDKLKRVIKPLKKIKNKFKKGGNDEDEDDDYDEEYFYLDEYDEYDDYSEKTDYESEVTDHEEDVFFKYDEEPHNNDEIHLNSIVDDILGKEKNTTISMNEHDEKEKSKKPKKSKKSPNKKKKGGNDESSDSDVTIKYDSDSDSELEIILN